MNHELKLLQEWYLRPRTWRMILISKWSVYNLAPFGSLVWVTGSTNHQKHPQRLKDEQPGTWKMMLWSRWFSFTTKRRNYSQVPSFFLKSSGDVSIIACLVAWKLKPARSLQTYDVLFRARRIEQTTGTFEKNRGNFEVIRMIYRFPWSLFSVCPFFLIQNCEVS